MRHLMLMRHGEAESIFDAKSDHTRCLTEFGKNQTAAQAHRFAPKPNDTLLVSDAMRTQQTAQILMDIWRSLAPDMAPTLTLSTKAYLADFQSYMDLIGMTSDDTARLWVIGHNPGISELAFHLTQAYVGMGTSDIAEIQLDMSHWLNIGPVTGQLLGHHQGRTH